MKRLLMFLLALLLCVPALADKVELPGYTILDGWDGTEISTYLAINDAGETVILGCVKTAEGWEITESTPLPWKPWDMIKANVGYIELPLSIGESAATTVTVEYQDGAWQVTELYISRSEMQVRDNGYYIPWDGAYFGDLPFDRDVTAIDWSALPTTEEEAIAGLDVSAWRILKEDTGLPRRSDMLVDEFRAGTPVRLLSEEDGPYVRAAILGGSAVYDVPVDALLPGETQFEEELPACNFTWLEITEDMTPPVLYAAPGGEVAHVLESGTAYDFATYDFAILTTGEIPGGVVCAQPDMSDAYIPAGASERWLYAADFAAGVDGFLRVDDLPPDMPYMVARRLLPEYRFLQGDVDEDNCCFLVERPADGAVLFAGCTLVEGEWVVTLSNPLPENASLDTFHGSGDYAILSYDDAETGLASLEIFGEEMPWKTCVLVPMNGGWHVETIGNDWSSFSSARCTLLNDYGSQLWWCTPGFDTNLATLRWDELPDTIEEALTLSDIADWVVLTADTPLLDAPGGVSLGLYHSGTGLRVLDAADGWLQVAVADGGAEPSGAVIGFVPADAVIPSADNYAEDEEGWGCSLYISPYVSLRRGEPAVQLYSVDGAVLHEFPTQFYKVVRMLGEQGDFYHVYDDDTGLDGFVLKSECEVLDE